MAKRAGGFANGFQPNLLDSEEDQAKARAKFHKKALAARKRAARKASATNIVRVLNLGAGVQSTALILMDALVHQQGRRDEVEAWLERDYPFPPIDFAVFADTQDEPEEVYRHLAKLKGVGRMVPILETTRGCLGDNLVRGVNATGQRFASIPAFTSEVEGVEQGIVRRQCTSEYKIEPVEQAIRRDIFGLAPGRTLPADSKVIQVFGLSYDEPGRVARVKARLDATGWSEGSFPLVELEMERPDCLSFLRSFDWDAPRSACVFCPFKGNAEWRRLRDTDPAGWRRALEVDAALRDPKSACTRNLDKKLYLHRSCVPLERAPIDDPEFALGFSVECEGVCGN